MGEIMIKVGSPQPDNPKATQDGDIVVAISDRYARCKAAERKCYIGLTLFSRDGLRVDGLSRIWREHTCEYRFERVGRDQVRRVNLRTGQTDIIGRTPNAAGEYMNVEAFIRRRVRHHRHAVFGSPGAEVWYGGHTFTADADLTAAWEAIEAFEQQPEPAQHRWRWGRMEVRRKLCCEVGPLTDAQAITYTESLFGMVRMPWGDEEQRVRARNFDVPWRDFVSQMGTTVEDVQDVSKPIEIRDRALAHATLARAKPALVTR